MKSLHAWPKWYFILFVLFTLDFGFICHSLAHEHDDYAAAELARERNEPAFVAPEIQALAEPGIQTLAAEGPLNQIGQWGPVLTWGFAFQGAANLPDGRIIAWGANNRFVFNGGSSAFAAIWDPVTDQFLDRNHTSHPLFCSIPTMLEDGRLFVNGGDTNTNKVSTFDYRTNQWTRVESMNTGRWYPGSVALPNGKVLTMLGRPGGIYPEIWTEGQGWSLQTGTDLNNGVLNFGGHRSTWLPHLNLKPDGEIFHSGPTQQMNSIDPSGNGSITSAGLSNSWYPNYSAGIMYDEGKLLIAGGAVNGVGSSPGTNQAMIIDFNSSTPTKTNIAPMAFARQFSNGVVLPTGEVLVIGGNTSGVVFSDSGTILTPETWNPDTQTWREMADMSVPRNYHSVALLMPDGRVWSGGGGLCNCSADHPDHQVYSPPYLFNTDGSLATRPSISSAPNTVGRGDVILVQATSGIQRFSMIKMSSISHNLNSDLRSLKIPFTQTGADEYELTIHTNPNVLTPGYWMLFAVDGQDVPSVAKVIQVQSAPHSGNQAPVVTNPGAQTHTEGDTLSLPISASDADGDMLTFSVTELPAGLGIDSSTGVIAGTVASGSAGTFSVTTSVSDGIESVSVTFTWTVSMVPPENTVRDTFNSVSYRNNDGTVNWAGNWIEDDQFGGGAGTGQVAIENGQLTLEDQPDTGTQPNARREVNLTGATSATLSFDFGTTSGVDTSDSALAEVSSNGGSSWTTLETFTGISGSTSGTRSYDISGSIAANTQVRFRVNAFYGASNEFFLVDNVEIAFDSTGDGTPVTQSINVRVSDSSNDAEERSNGDMYHDSTDLELVNDTFNNAGDQTVGLRFTGVAIPQDATIVNAYVQFQADESHSGNTSLTIKGDNTNNAGSFTTSIGNISSRSMTATSVEWSPAAWSTGQAGSAQQTPNLAGVIQEIVNRGGWSSGNALVIIVTGSGKRVAESFDGNPSTAPLLHVEFQQ